MSGARPDQPALPLMAARTDGPADRAKEGQDETDDPTKISWCHELMPSTMADMGTGNYEPAEPDLVDGLVQLSFAVQQILGRVGAEYQLSIIQARLLGILRDREPTMAALARFLMLDKSSITGLVDRAERRGLVQRTASPRDGRSVQVALTRRGREIAGVFAHDVEYQITALVTGFTDTERRRLSGLASRVVRREAALKGLSLAPETGREPIR
jgi:MarR family transcriptional regulator, lower aerobic nicotinate degradation pathway regulator